MPIQTFDSLIKVKRTFFGLPFMMAGALLPFAMGMEVSFPPVRWLWILLAFCLARTAGMAFNEVIDREIDGLNPRTQGRVLPSGQMGVGSANGIAWASLLAFVAVCYQINPATYAASPVVALIIYAYAYTKRFTSWCHFVLGVVHFAAPVMACLAITGQFVPSSFLLGATALCVIVANDIVYAMQDYVFDLEHNLHSIPVALGPRRALMLSRYLFSAALILMSFAGLSGNLPAIYYVGVVGAMYAVLHYDRVLLRRGEEGIPKAFFRCNVIFAACTLISVVGAILWRALS